MRLIRPVDAASVILILALGGGLFASTRWSANHLVPDADLIKGGEFVVDGQGFMYFDETVGTVVRPTALLRLGIIEWVNIEGGYAGGATLGLKARILGETHPFMPSLAVGAHNVIAHKEVNYFGDTVHENMANEFFLVFGKTVDPIATRFHLGLQTIPQEPTELLNPFLSIEKYFGMGFYATLEVQRRHESAVASLFGSWRLLRRRLEISLGVVDLYHMFARDGDTGFSLVSSQGRRSFSRPGFWFGLRWLGDMHFGGRGGFRSLEETVTRQTRQIDSLQEQVDSLRTAGWETGKRLRSLDKSVVDLVGNNPSDRERLKALILDKIISLRSLYGMDPFEPEKVKETVDAVTVYGERAVPPLKELLADRGGESTVRMYAAMLLGQIGLTSSADALLGVLGSGDDPNIKIEALIALGKMKETRAVYLMEQLANDPDDGVAITAQEVLDRLRKETGVKISAGTKFRNVEEGGAPPSLGARIDANPPAGAARKDSASAAKTSTQPSKADSSGAKKSAPASPSTPASSPKSGAAPASPPGAAATPANAPAPSPQSRASSSAAPAPTATAPDTSHATAAPAAAEPRPMVPPLAKKKKRTGADSQPTLGPEPW